MQKHGLFKVILFMLFTGLTFSFTTAPPTWLTSPFFRANNEAVISSYTGSDQTPTYTFTFSSALPGVPNIAYGIRGYEGKYIFI